ncbi:MAG TPA: hypothetical protein VKM35_10040 [Arenimonas sp.]|uniref:hypothetical protein n=1 Tax=Arenimonas sp. TaxID=1872635 RepID=UPI002CB352F9|nr:hypothetical protein [Arenimonas sp.]HMB57536.1 hypothetical protein [Arenimonas sp.]
MFTNRPRAPYMYAYVALLPGCVLGALGLLAYALMAGPGSVDFSAVVVAALLVLVWFGYSLVVGVALISIYVVPMIWLLLRLRLAGPVPMIVVSLLPGAALWLLGATQYQKFALFLLGFGACVGLAYCLLAYRKGQAGWTAGRP